MNTIAIILPLYDRPDFAIRFLDFYNRKKCKFSFYIPDGSKKKFFTQKYLERKFRNLKIIYKSYPYDKNFYMFIKKMNSISKIIREKYIMLIADDDFFNLEFIKKAKKYLDKNKEFSLVAGLIKNIRVILPFKSINDHGYVLIQKSIQYSQYGSIFEDVSSNNKEKRLKNFLMTLPYESLIRSSVFKKIFSLAKEFKVQNSFELTWFMNFIPLAIGKKKQLKLLSQIRQCNTYTGLGQHDMLYNTGASRTRYLKFLKMLENKKIITFKITNLLKKNIDNNILDIIDKKNMDKKYNFLKIKIIILYIIF